MKVAPYAAGLLLERDQLVFAHKGEQILPERLSQSIRLLIESRKRRTYCPDGGDGDS